MSLSAADIARLSAWLAASGLGELELSGPGCHVRLRHDGGVVTEVDHVVAVRVVTSPSVGWFLPAHPLCDTPIAPIGTLVEAGQPLGLLRIGALLLPVMAPVAGVVADFLAAPGAVVGYAAPLVELHPVAE